MNRHKFNMALEHGVSGSRVEIDNIDVSNMITVGAAE